MIKKISVFIVLFLVHSLVFGQEKLPVLHTTNKVLSIKDGTIVRENYWTISPDIELDVYVADKTSATKTVTFYSDIDSISFVVQPRQAFNFLILLNQTDSCFTQIKSGVTYQKKAVIDERKDTIPFSLTPQNNISIQTILNQKDTVNLMFHTGVNSVSLTERTIKRINEFRIDDTISVQSWGGEGSARYSRNNHLEIGQLNWEKVTIWTDKNSGRDTDGKFGPNLFEDKIIEINYEERIIVLHPILPTLNPDFESFALTFDRSAMLLHGRLKINETTYLNQFMIHSGYSGTILFDDKFSKENGLGTKLKTISESQLTDSFGNVLKTKKAILPFFEIGGSEFENLPIGFFEGAIGNQKISVLGSELLKRFNIFIDLQTAYIYLKPNELMELPFKDA